MQQVKEANELILRENIRLKMQLKNLLPAAKQHTFQCAQCQKKFTSEEYL